MLQAGEGEAAEAGDRNGAGYDPNGTNHPTKKIGMLALSLSLLRSVLAVLVTGALAAGCGFAGGPNLTLGYLEWDENVAVSSLTKVLLQEELGYHSVELKLADDVKPVYEMVASGEADAFQDTWMPNQAEILRSVENDVELLDPWFEGATKTSIATPSYMHVESIAELNDTRIEHIIGIEPGSPFMDKLTDSVIPEYDLDQQLIAADTPAMLAEVQKRYRTREDFAFVAWSPHWMNEVYDFDYLEDPKGALGALTEGSDVSTIVRESLAEEDPTAYAFIDNLQLTEEQVNALEREINEAKDPVEGAKTWLRGNRGVVEPWIEAAKNAGKG
ncbi:MAG: glycine betaine ABC transporter substrate-binding protein [Actinomycetota bacterium]|nr:glycine betaine ABC transporter substrate-binding protein [Actinomycetota bacterium]